MKDTNIFCNIKKDSLLKIFNAFLDNKRSSRRKIEEITGLSFVTVSKAADSFVELNILKQHYLSDPSLARRSRVLSAKFYYWIGIYTITKEMFSFDVYDLSLKSIHQYNYIPSTDASIKESLREFIKRSRSYANSVNTQFDNCCGIGILVPGFYNNEKDIIIGNSIPHIGALRVYHVFSRFFDNSKILVKPIFAAYANELQAEYEGCKSIYALFINKGNILGSYVNCGGCMDSIIMNVGDLYGRDRIKLNTSAIKPPNIEPFFDDITDILFTLMHTVPIDEIRVSGNLFPRIDIVSEYINKKLNKKCQPLMIIPPEVHGDYTLPLAKKNIARKIRTDWFMEKIIQEDTP